MAGKAAIHEENAEIYIGVDLTAGTWESGMMLGPKPFVWAAAGKTADKPALIHVQQETDLAAFLAAALVRQAAAIAIDGPCGAVGIRLNDDASGWELGETGLRAAERELAKLGYGLFWTSAASIARFDGAARWIARSLRLFDLIRREPRLPCPIETYPHAVFNEMAGRQLPKKNTADGRAARLAALSMRMDGIDPERLPDHDHLDAAACAWMAAEHAAGRSRMLGRTEAGGFIHLPASAP